MDIPWLAQTNSKNSPTISQDIRQSDLQQLVSGASKRQHGDFPSGPVAKNPPRNAGDMGSIPGGGIPHRPQGNCAHMPQLLECTGHN